MCANPSDLCFLKQLVGSFVNNLNNLFHSGEMSGENQDYSHKDVFKDTGGRPEPEQQNWEKPQKSLCWHENVMKKSCAPIQCKWTHKKRAQILTRELGMGTSNSRPKELTWDLYGSSGASVTSLGKYHHLLVCWFFCLVGWFGLIFGFVAPGMTHLSLNWISKTWHIWLHGASRKISCCDVLPLWKLLAYRHAIDFAEWFVQMSISLA